MDMNDIFSMFGGGFPGGAGGFPGGGFPGGGGGFPGGGGFSFGGFDEEDGGFGGGVPFGGGMPGGSARRSQGMHNLNRTYDAKVCIPLHHQVLVADAVIRSQDSFHCTW